MTFAQFNKKAIKMEQGDLDLVTFDTEAQIFSDVSASLSIFDVWTNNVRKLIEVQKKQFDSLNNLHKEICALLIDEKFKGHWKNADGGSWFPVGDKEFIKGMLITHRDTASAKILKSLEHIDELQDAVEDVRKYAVTRTKELVDKIEALNKAS